MFVGEKQRILFAGNAVLKLQPKSPFVVNCKPDRPPEKWQSERGATDLGDVIFRAAKKLLDELDYLEVWLVSFATKQLHMTVWCRQVRYPQATALNDLNDLHVAQPDVKAQLPALRRGGLLGILPRTKTPR